jgi:hypothetical protein
VARSGTTVANNDQLAKLSNKAATARCPSRRSSEPLQHFCTEEGIERNAGSSTTVLQPARETGESHQLMTTEA